MTDCEKKFDEEDQKQEVRQITASEVARHNRYGDMWIVIDGRVYDVTDFKLEHPGGPNAILDHAGSITDKAREAFEGQGHSDFAREQLRDMFIGYLVEEEVALEETTSKLEKININDKCLAYVYKHQR